MASGEAAVELTTDPDEKLGYSRHYAQRIRDLGKTSKESWIKRLWNHMFGTAAQERSPSTLATSVGPNSDWGVRDSQSDTYQVSGKSASATSREKEVRFAGNDERKTSQDSGVDSQKSSGVQEDGLPRRRVTSSTQDQSSVVAKDLPARLANSPYLPPKEKVVYYRPVLTQTSKDESHDGVAAAKLRYQKLASSSASSTSKIAVIDLSSSSAPNIRVSSSFDATSSSGRRINQPHALRAAYGNAKEPVKSEPVRPKITRDPAIILLEKRAKTIADRAIRSAKIFTCNAPYPVDTFVRLGLRQRGWVEKFGPRVTLGVSTTTANTTDRILQCKTDKDFEEICQQTIPKPWEEDKGVYAVISRYVHRCPAKFIWAGKSINSVVLKSDVVVNHFPKAKYFSSKVLLATSLKDLPWHSNTDPMSFFPRCYVLSDENRGDVTDDFQMTACIALMKLAIGMYDHSQTGDFSAQSFDTATADSTTGLTMDPSEPAGYSSTDSYHPPADTLETEVTMNWSVELQHENSAVDNVEPERDHEVEANDEESAEDVTQCAADITDDDVEDRRERLNQLTYEQKPKVVPDLGSAIKEKKGGLVPAKAVDWAIQHCQRYIRSKNHEDLDKNRRGLSNNQLSQLLDWYYQVSQDGASVHISDEKVKECESVLKKMRQLWPQYDIDGCRNIWIVKPGDKSKGIGISFCDKLSQLMKVVDDPATQGYIVQKYIERPLLIYKCKFDVRQWFLVTDWSPLTVWFYKDSYLRICSQEFSYDSMHESVHLSNVAVQENYINGERSSLLPENNFMTSEQFKQYLSDIGVGEMWDTKIYPGMKTAVLNTLIATQEFTDSRKSAFELYGADFMMSEDYRPWLLEVNSSPGMLPSSIDKAKLCFAVISDTIKVVLDHRENSMAETGRFELIYHDTSNPNTRGTDSKLLVEGLKIKKTDLQRYTTVDQRAMKIQKDKENRALEKQNNKLAALKAATAEEAKTDDHGNNSEKSTGEDPSEVQNSGGADKPGEGNCDDLKSSSNVDAETSRAAAAATNSSSESGTLSSTADMTSTRDSSVLDDVSSDDELERYNREQMEFLTAGAGEMHLQQERPARKLQTTTAAVDQQQTTAVADRANKAAPGLRKSTIDIYSGKDNHGAAGVVARPKPLLSVSKPVVAKR